MVRLVFSWNIKSDEEPAYFEFIVQEFAPKIIKMGIRPTEAWYTVYGEGPQIIMPAIAADRESLQRVLNSNEWLELIDKLNNFVTDYQCRILD
ncbi:MAG: hypothetical protein RMN52_01025 [Anaerolineae bacterium]|nr:hypothetical protein [Candidatus Roseilinea sp.]MDW8448560.1 hypothetical protein [Anaerolineae bacterium]